MKTFSMDIIFSLGFIVLFIAEGMAQECNDLRGTDYCRFLLKPKDNNCQKLSVLELVNCHKTCLVCKPPAPVQPNAPSWAIPQTPRAPLYPIPPPPKRTNENEGGLSIPLWAVVLIVVALIALFILCTCAFIKIKRKYKKWKINRNHKLLRNAPPAANTMIPSNAPGYIWQMENGGMGHMNHAYSYDYSNKNLYPPEMVDNLGTKEKNTNEMQSTLSKRQAPQPPKEKEKKQMNNAKTDTMRSTKSKAPDPPEYNKLVEYPIEYTESMVSFASETESKKPSKDADRSKGSDTPPVPPRVPLIMKMSMNSDDTYASVYKDDKDEDEKEKNKKKRKASKKQKRVVDSDDVKDTSDESGSSSDSDTIMSDNTMATHRDFPNDALINVMEKWKDHLQDQKKELEDYYSRLATYVGRLALDQQRNPSDDQQSGISDMTWQDPAPAMHRSASMPQRPRRESETTYDFPLKERSLSHRFTFPEPPESIRGDFDIEPYNLESQQEVIIGLKSKLAELQTVLNHTDDMVGEAESMATWKPRDEFEVEQIMPKKPVINRNALKEASDTHFTIKFLLDQFDRKSRIGVQIKIAEAFDNVRNRGGMTIIASDGSAVCLSKQVHHVMTDLLDPRTNTKLALGAHASLNLSMKLRRSFLKAIYPQIENTEIKEKLTTNIEHVIVVCKQLVDMTNQLIVHEESFRIKDYLVFANAFVKTAVKVMEETYAIKEEIDRLKRKRAEQNIKKRTLSADKSSKFTSNLTPDDVRKLNEGLARLEAVLNGHLTAKRENSNDTNETYGYDDCTDSELETLTAYSCSTCAPPETNDYEGRYPSHMTASALGHPPNKVPKGSGVNYTQVFPYSKPKRNKQLPKNEILLNKNDDTHMAAPFSSDYDLDHRTNTLGASSFSFGTSSVSKMDATKQPRNEAMLGRYLNSPEKFNTNPNQNTVPIMPMPLPVNPLDQSESPTVKILPGGGMVATDTPPMTDKPKEKKIRGKLGKIPKITVVRNGSEVDKSAKLPVIEETEPLKSPETQDATVVPPPPPPGNVSPPEQDPTMNKIGDEDQHQPPHNDEAMNDLKTALAAKFNRQESKNEGDQIEDQQDFNKVQDDKEKNETDEDSSTEKENGSDGEEEEGLFNYPVSDPEDDKQEETKENENQEEKDDED